MRKIDLAVCHCHNTDGRSTLVVLMWRYGYPLAASVEDQARHQNERTWKMMRPSKGEVKEIEDWCASMMRMTIVH